jgi:hypothetical protein
MSATSRARRVRGVALLLVVLVVGGLLALGWRRPGTEQPFRSPEQCIEAYRDAGRDGDPVTFGRCLGPGLRSQGDRLFAEANRQLQAVRHWNQYAAETTGTSARIRVDQVCSDGMIHRVSYRLAQSDAGWQIVEIGKTQVLAPPVRTGTHIRETDVPPAER